MESTTHSPKTHVAVLAFPFGCHPIALFKLVEKLASAAPETQFSFFNIAKCNDGLLSASKANILNNIEAYEVADGVPTNYVFSGNPIEEVELFLKASPENFRISLDLAVAKTGKKISCLISDVFLLFAGSSIAKDLSVSWIPVWTSLPHSLAVHIYTDMIRQLYYDSFSSGDGEKTLDRIPGLSKICLSDVPPEVWGEGSHQETHFSHMLSQVGAILPRATALVMDFYDELYPASLLNDLRRKLPSLLNVGFLTLTVPPPPLPSSDTDASGCLSWLDTQKPLSVAYISFGTVASVPPEEINELAEALEECKVPFLWSLRDNLKDSLPEGFAERTSKHGKVVPWAAQIQVLAHSATGVFVTHCGSNSVCESIVHGVPMICRPPVFGDNQMNGRVVEDEWEVGVRVDGGVFTRNGIVKSLKLILEDEQGRGIRRRVEALRELVLKAAAPGGHASQDFNTLVETVSML
ncbi:hypothetical protein Tsubulata_011746 [Turnera subulata]|uniref:Glycosyltransferase n=1 Tax=Turnera subulata TaxID=218843 RepID=A0A9Q0GFJ7_9ROSI|nr:hypothetical protein Tsubulata_011746 [Turnera subulata]